MKIKMIDLFKLMLERKTPKKIRVLGIDMTFIETAEWGDYEDEIRIIGNIETIVTKEQFEEMSYKIKE